MRQHILRLTCRTVNNGGIIAYPTESVYGLGCDPQNFFALTRIYAIKQRPNTKASILVAANIDQIIDWIIPPKNHWQHVIDSWPGPTTWIVQKSPSCPPWLGTKHAIAVRISANPTIQHICTTLQHPLISTSANISKHKPARTALMTRRIFGTQLDYIVPGKTGGSTNTSTIIDAETLKKIR
jgi:L-threonylcarbamoyladenylate synthase